jgi:hypothetical protein
MIEDATLEFAGTATCLALLLAGLRFVHLVYGLSLERLITEALCCLLYVLHQTAEQL